MGLSTPQSAILSAIIFNALIIIALIPLALRGVAYRARSAASLLRRNLLVYGIGGIIVPFVGIKLIDLVGLGPSWPALVTEKSMFAQLRPAIVLMVLMTVLARPRLSLRHHRHRRRLVFPDQANGSLIDPRGRDGDRLQPDRPGLRVGEVFPRPSLGGGRQRL